jgi:hypothetical protein
MTLTTIFWRPVNYLRGQAVRANSRHTSAGGLANLYLKGPSEIKEQVMVNLRERILSGAISPEQVAKMPPLLVRITLESCGWRKKEQ